MRKAERPWSLTSVREAGKDRRQGRQPRALRRRGRGAATDVRRDPVADRPAAGTARAGMSGAGSLCGKRRQERYASVCAIQRSGALDAGFERLSPTATAISVAQAGQRRDPALENPRIWRISG